MKEQTTSRGSILTLPDNIAIQDDGGRAVAQRGVRRRGPIATQRDGEDAASTDALLAGLELQNVTATDEFVLAPEPSAPGGRRRSAAETDEPATLNVPLTADEQAVVLVERDGVFAWIIPEPEKKTPKRRRRGGRSVAPARSATFKIGMPPATPRRAAQRRRGFITDKLVEMIIDPVRVHVLKFAAGRAVDFARKRIDEKVTPGLILMDGNDPDRWVAGAAPTRLKKPAGRPLRILLMVHGTFSSTRGSFGALGLMPAGRKFLEDARSHYDAILSYDHWTLGATPQENAEDIAAALTDLNLPKGTRIDAVAFSRGGLVYRTLVERILVKAGSPYTFGKAVFVGCTNGGTALADPANWTAFLDLYTNLAVAAGKGLAFFDAGTASRILTESVKTLGGLVQAVVDTAIVDEMVPGLAAMQPAGPVVKDLNGTVLAKDKSKIEYYALGSDFEPTLFGREASAKGLSAKFMGLLADAAVDKLMGEENDLVVDTEAMTQFGKRSDRLVDKLYWDDNAVIFHTNYFQHPDIVRTVAGWLGLGAATPANRPVVDEIVTIDAETALAEAARKVRRRMVKASRTDAKPAVVISRENYGYYVRSSDDVLRAARSHDPKVAVREVLDIHETTVAMHEDSTGPMPERMPGTGWVRLKRGRAVEAVYPAVRPELSADTDRSLDLEEAAPPSPAARARRPATAPAPSKPTPSARRGRGPAAKTTPARKPAGKPAGARAAVAEEVSCDFAAEMTEHPPLDVPAELTVTVSREVLDIVKTAAAGRARAKVKPSDPIAIDVSGQRNCDVVGTASSEVRVPDPGQPESYDFKIKGKGPGPAEVWVTIHQGARRLARIVLQPTFMATDGRIQASAIASSLEEDPPMLQLRVREIRNADSYRLNFVAQSRELGINLDRDSEPLKIPQEDFVASIYKRLEGDWGKHRKSFAKFMSRLEDYGATLYGDLVPLDIRKAIWQNRDRIGSIEIDSDEPFIPWEILFITDPKDGIISSGSKFLAEMGIVRWIGDGFPPASVRVRDGMAYYVIPSYPLPRLALPGAQAEIDVLSRTFGAAPVEPAESTSVLDLLKQPGAFDLLHFACHGEAQDDRIWDAGLLMAGWGHTDSDYEEDVLAATGIRSRAQMLHPDGSRPMVFLNACQAGKTGRTLTGTGGMAEAFISRGTGLFIGTLWSIGDDTSLTFAETFYASLKSGKTVAQATRAGREAARQADEPTWLAYTVYGHPYGRLQAG